MNGAGEQRETRGISSAIDKHECARTNRLLNGGRWI